MTLSVPKKGNPKLAAALRMLKRLQEKHQGVVEAGDLSDDHRILLVDAGFLQPIMKGWYMCGNPGVSGFLCVRRFQKLADG